MSVVTEVQTLLDDSGVFWLAQHVYDASNEAQLYVWEELRHDITTQTLTVSASTTLVTLPTSIYIPQRIIRAQFEWFPTTYLELERDSRLWRSVNPSTPVWFVNWDAEHLRPYPLASAEIEFTIEGVSYPGTEITTGTEDISAIRPVKQAVIWRAAAILSQNTRPQLAASLAAAAEDYLSQAREHYHKDTGRHNIKRLRPGTIWTHAHQGVINSGRWYSGLLTPP